VSVDYIGVQHKMWFLVWGTGKRLKSIGLGYYSNIKIYLQEILEYVYVYNNVKGKVGHKVAQVL
jgi:hypothetical protein